MPSAHLCRALHRLGVASLGSREPSAFTLLPHFTGEGTAVKEVKGLVAELTDDERAGTQSAVITMVFSDLGHFLTQSLAFNLFKKLEVYTFFKDIQQ